MKTFRVAATTATGVLLCTMLQTPFAVAQTAVPGDISNSIGVDFADVAGDDMRALLHVDDTVLDQVKSTVESFFNSNKAASDAAEVAESLVTEFAPKVDKAKDAVSWNFSVDELASAYGDARDKQMVLLNIPKGVDPASVTITRGKETIDTVLNKDTKAVAFSASVGDDVRLTARTTQDTPGQLSALTLPVTGDKPVFPVVDPQSLLDAVSQVDAVVNKDGSVTDKAGKPVEFAGVGVGLDEPITDVTEQLFAGGLNVADIAGQLQSLLGNIDLSKITDLLGQATNTLGDVVGALSNSDILSNLTGTLSDVAGNASGALGNLSSGLSNGSSQLANGSSNMQLPELQLPELNVPELNVPELKLPEINGSSGLSSGSSNAGGAGNSINNGGAGSKLQIGTIGGAGNTDKEFSVASLTPEQLRSAVSKLDRVEDLEKVRRELASTPEAIVLNAEKIKIVDDRIAQVTPVEEDSTTSTGGTGNSDSGKNSKGTSTNTVSTTASGEKYITGVHDGQVIVSDDAVKPVSNTSRTATQASTTGSGDDIMSYDEYRGVTTSPETASSTSTAPTTVATAEPTAGGAKTTSNGGAPEVNQNNVASDQLALTGVSDSVGTRVSVAAGLVVLTLLSLVGIVVLKRRS